MRYGKILTLTENFLENHKNFDAAKFQFYLIKNCDKTEIKIEFYNLESGTGYTFKEGGAKQALLTKFREWLYRLELTLRRNDEQKLRENINGGSPLSICDRA